MHILEVTTKVTALRECLPAFWACKRSLTRVLSKVVTKVTAFLKNRATATMSALKVQFYSHGFRVAHLDSLMPVAGNTLKCLWLGPEQRGLCGCLFGFLTFFDVVSQKFGFFFQATYLRLLCLISLWRSMKDQLILWLYISGTFLLLHEELLGVMRHETLRSLGLKLGQANLCRMAGLRLLHGLGGKLV